MFCPRNHSYEMSPAEHAPCLKVTPLVKRMQIQTWQKHLTLALNAQVVTVYDEVFHRALQSSLFSKLYLAYVRV